jgi:hypothetical protein
MSNGQKSTDLGLPNHQKRSSLQLTLQGTKYYTDDDLNKTTKS